ncbi:hypothetical protein [uncultured Gimesia sp.]|uniref:hypothetical protein n=1 Tax=uncultured Gimesia sp. TaxID=1678688 RepID=UPI0030D9C4DF
MLSVFILVLSLMLIGLSEETGLSDQPRQTTAEQAGPSKTDRSDANQTAPDLKTKENIRHLEEDLASCRLFRVHLELSKLIQKYPHTKAGKRAQRLLEGAGMRVIDFPMKTSDNCYRKGVPDYRYSNGIYSSIPEHVREGIRLY